MGKDFKDGPRGEAKRYVDDDGNEVHVSMDNRNISGSKPEETAKRLKDRKIGQPAPAKKKG